MMMRREIAAEDRMGTSATGRRVETFNMAGHSRSLRNHEPVVHEHGVGEGTRDRLPDTLHRRATVERHVQRPSGDDDHSTLVVGGGLARSRCQHRDDQRRGGDGMTGHGFFVLFFGAASWAASARSVAGDSCSVVITLPVAASTLTSSTPVLPATVKSYE